MKAIALKVLSEALGCLAAVTIAVGGIVGVLAAGMVVITLLLTAILMVAIVSLSAVVWVPGSMVVLVIWGLADDVGSMLSMLSVKADKGDARLVKMRKAYADVVKKGRYDSDKSETPVS